MPRFVLLCHECPSIYKPSHWDLMLEMHGVLATWELRELPTEWVVALSLDQQGAGSKLAAARLPDHRLDYLDYEGPVSGNRGTVKRIEGGSFEIRESSPDMLIAMLLGESLRGLVELTRVQESDAWELEL